MSHLRLWIVAQVLIAILAGTLYAQEQKIDSRIWSISYWQKLANQGLVETAPDLPVPEAAYTGKKTGIPGVSFENTTDIPIIDDPNTTQSENSVFVHPLNVNKALNSNNSTTNPVSLLYGADYWITADGGARRRRFQQRRPRGCHRSERPLLCRIYYQRFRYGSCAFDR